jgi:signal transduction histidine kinase
MPEQLRILLIDDDRDDYILTRDLLNESTAAPAQLRWASTYEEGLAALLRREHEVCLLDYRLGTKTGLDLLREPGVAECDGPIILLTGQGEREIDMQAMEAGAADYLTKDRLDATNLERTIRHSIERHRDRKALRQMNELLEQRVEERTRELGRLNAALVEADRRKDEFLATLAHELRNPLAPVANSLELLKQSEHDLQTTREARATMERQVAQIVRLVEDLLDVSRISRGKINLRKVNVPVADVVKHAVEASSPLIERSRHRLNVHLPAEPITLHADPARLAQIISNLLNNASKFTPGGGQIDLIVARERDAAAICVRDTGVGIAPQELERIFDMFTQIDAPSDHADGGLGIGLTLAKNLVELHGGTIDVASAGRDRGSEFTVRIPLGENAAPLARPVAKPAPRASRRRVLVVDDNKDAANSLGLLLRHDGHDVTVAFNGKTAVDQAAAMQPDFVLLDIGLPDINGYEVAREIRKDAGDRPLVLVALTGWGQDEDRQKSRYAGIDHHWVKPVDYRALAALLAAE